MFCLIPGLYRELTYDYKDSFPVEYGSSFSKRRIRVDLLVYKTGDLSLYSSSHRNAKRVENPRFIFHCLTSSMRDFGTALVYERNVSFFQSGES